MTEQNDFWPGGARLAVTVSMQFEAGGQPVSGAGGPITEPVLPGFPDLGQNTFYEYGAREGTPCTSTTSPALTSPDSTRPPTSSS
jgi:hypothetical protein